MLSAESRLELVCRIPLGVSNPRKPRQNECKPPKVQVTRKGAVVLRLEPGGELDEFLAVRRLADPLAGARPEIEAHGALQRW